MTYTLYIKSYCPYSINAMKLLKKKKIKFIKHDVEKLGGTQAVITALKKKQFIANKSKHNTVPIIFNDSGKFIGGYDDLQIFLH